MLFELGGKRKRFIQVIYVGLALLLGGGLVLFGIGGDANGGLLNAVGLGSDDPVQSDPAFDNQIERAEEALAADPEDEGALLTLARVNFGAGQNELGTDEQGNRTITDEAIARYEASVDAWERYLALEPDPVDDDVAGLMVQSYANVAGTGSISDTEDQLAGAVEAAQVVSEARPSLGSFTTLGIYAYFAEENKLAEQARADALREASDETARTQVKQQLDSAKAQAKLLQEQLASSAPDKSALENPFEGIGGSATPAPLPGG